MHYWILRGITIFILKALFQLRIEGLENLPKKTNFIVAANHTSYLDPLVIGAAIPQKIHWITLRQVYNWFFLKWVMLKKEALPAGNVSEKAITLLMEGKNICIFPEGTRSIDGQLKNFRTGTALLAIKTGRPVVPCAILGAYEAFPRIAKFPRFSPIKVRIGKPQYLLKEFDEIIDDIFLQEGMFRIKNAIKEMAYAGS